MAISTRQVKNKRDSNGVLTGRPGTVYDVNIKYTAPNGEKKTYSKKGFPTKKETTSPAIPVFPMLKTVEQMSKISGIGENKLRELMDSGELEYIQNGNRRLIADAAIWDWYHRAKTTAKPPARQGG